MCKSLSRLSHRHTPQTTHVFKYETLFYLLFPSYFFFLSHLHQIYYAFNAMQSRPKGFAY